MHKGRQMDYSIIGQRFGRLVVTSINRKNGQTFCECNCDCGNTKTVRRGQLTSGDTISCGCYHKEHNSEFGKKHGLSKHPLYTVWSGIIQRCTNQNAENYKRYGGRGITVCDEWKNDFKSFYDWASSNGYLKGLTIERINNDQGYTPDNCRWATISEQANNKRKNHFFTYNDITHTIAEWSRILNVNAETLRYRVMHDNLVDFEHFYNYGGEHNE